MKVVFNKITIQNLLSFGNSETVLNIENGLNLIVGPNGGGKSSALLDAISFGLYDKPYRKINKADLINRKNKKNLKVDVEFTINDIKYRIVRGMKNKNVDLIFYIDDVKQKLLSSKALTQIEIENKIGIDYKLFKQIISLSINHNKPFLTLPAGEKRELLEKFVNIDVLADMLKVAKSEVKNLKLQKNIHSNNINMISRFLKTEKSRIVELEASKKTFDSDKKSEIFNITSLIKDKKDELRKVKAEGKDEQKKLKDYSDMDDITELRNLKDGVNKNIATYEFAIKSANTILNALDEYDICPTCKSNLTKEHKADEISIQNSIVINSTAEINKLNSELDIINNKISDVEDMLKVIQDIKYSIKTLKGSYTSIERRIIKLEDDKKRELNKEFIFDISSMKSEYNEKMKELKSNKSELIDIDINIERYDKIIVMLSDKGIKSYIFEQLIPVLNNNVNDYLQLFELPIYIEFDNSMTDSIKMMSNFNENVTYYSFSEGEKKKIDMAILLSFIDVTKKIANWNCNLLVIDELLDSAIDDVGLEKLLQSLERMVVDSPDSGVYIISHRLKNEYIHYFTNAIEIKKNSDGFSKMSVI